MKRTKDNDISHDSMKSDAATTVEKLSRREFAKSSVAAGAVAVTIPGVLQAAQQSSDGVPAPANSPQNAGSGTVEHRDGTTIPAEYYYEMKHYRKDEEYIAEKFWLMADHVSRVSEPGDFFVFKFGLGQSAIVVRNESGDIKAFHNVCRHRGSADTTRIRGPMTIDCQFDNRVRAAIRRYSVARITPGCTISTAISLTPTTRPKILTWLTMALSPVICTSRQVIFS